MAPPPSSLPPPPKVMAKKNRYIFSPSTFKIYFALFPRSACHLLGSASIFALEGEAKKKKRFSFLFCTKVFFLLFLVAGGSILRHVLPAEGLAGAQAPLPRAPPPRRECRTRRLCSRRRSRRRSPFGQKLARTMKKTPEKRRGKKPEKESRFLIAPS